MIDPGRVDVREQLGDLEMENIWSKRRVFGRNGCGKIFHDMWISSQLKS